MKTLSFDRPAFQDVEWALKREWLETNGLGGYSSSTLIGANTRRYHGLLVAATKPPRARYVLVSGLEETLFIDNQKYDLSTNIYPDVIYPKGYENLSKFLLTPFPTFLFHIDDILIEKTVFMVYDENTTVVSYRLLTGEAERVRLELRPKIAYRDFHSLASENLNLNTQIQVRKGEVSLSPYPNLPPVYFYHNAAVTDKSAYWYKKVEYPEEKERGFDYQEDLFSPCALIYSFLNQGEIYCIASTQKKESIKVEELRFREEKRRSSLEAPVEIQKDEIQMLWRQSSQFIVRAKDGLKHVIAGYHWFEDWGRDTFIALPGLALVTGRYQTAKELLSVYSGFISQGMIPNRFPDLEENPDYHEYYLETEDSETVMREFYPALKKIIKHYKEGTRHEIRMDKDGLLTAGDEHTHLTWMDASIGDQPVTSRHGKAVEVNALWYNALKIMEFFGSLFKDENEGGIFRDLAFQTKESFNETFWDKRTESLFDVVRADFKDDSVRPNQIFAISLPFPVLNQTRWKAVLKKVEDDLLTPVGLRSLSPKSPDYCGVYTGGPYERDRIYHQGCVWPWLMGAFVVASLKAFGRTKNVKLRLMKILDVMLTHIQDSGLGFYPEIFDGEAPHQARGAIAQAWSVSELLRAYMELVKDELKIEKAREFVLR
ncbi:MAG: glycogen debranching enzyme N-terminal domain-containing protein [Candidatus Omnitrophica bacterium]|nr:glycogen debranching enzyme N-terminal domain-containing protein [Candidatus Omnitrophota bacterium]